ncbi:MAG: SH3 domain-containing protein [Oscillochloris sp.]|nr:SH3 domain-containing protein [Oscillochloris sp.]
MFAGLERITRRLPSTRTQRSRMLRSRQLSVSREQIADLIAALGDTGHPRHSSAVDELVAIGSPAVPALATVIGPDQPWLLAYRAADAAGRIRDGRAAGALLRALKHQNSNVRWSAVRALTQVDDVRAALELRRIARTDQGRTSWGESVAGAAESALEQLRRRSIWGQSIELVKTAITAVLMILALTLAFSVVTTVRAEFDAFGTVIPGQTQIPQFSLPTVAPTASRTVPTARPVVGLPTAQATAPVFASDIITGTVLQVGNVRPFPGTNNEPIGRLNPGDEVVILGQNENNQWFLVRLAEEQAADSAIDNPDGSGSGWINQALVTAPNGEVPQATPVPTPSP